jgi:hypothetical protein
MSQEASLPRHARCESKENAMRAIMRLLFSVVFGCVLVACGGSDAPPLTPPPPPSPPTQVGPAGGTVSIGGVTFSVPPGALASSIVLTADAVAPSKTPPTDATPLSSQYELGPSGTTFASPVTIAVPFDPAQMQAGEEPVLQKWVNGGWVDLPSQLVSGDTVSATTTSFSTFRAFGFRFRPFILRPPADTTVTEPGVASFDAIALGSRPLTLQWERMRPGEAVFTAIDVAGEPSAAGRTYTTQGTTAVPSAAPPALEAAHGTQYRLVASNARGSATSAAATLSVLPLLDALNVTIGGQGTVTSTPAGVNCIGGPAGPGVCTASFRRGSSVSLSATPAAGYMFAGWSGTGCGPQVTMTGALSCTATFVTVPPVTHDLTISIVGNGSVTSVPGGIACPGLCSQAYPTGTSVTLTSVAAPGNIFMGWGGNCSGTAASTAVTMSAPRNCTASFMALTAPTVAGPLDLTVAEGASATFVATVTGSPPLTFIWERSDNNGASWGPPIAGCTTNSCVKPATSAANAGAGGDNGALYRVTIANGAGSVVSRSARLNVLSLASAAEVIVQFPPSGLIRSNTLATSTGAGYSATADLSAGTFAARASSATTETRFAYAMVLRLQLTNHNPGPVTIAAGDLKVIYSGTYTNVPSGGFGSGAASNTILTVLNSQTGTLYLAGLSHQTGIGNNGVPSQTLIPDARNGAVVLSPVATMTALSAELRMPEITVAAGGSLTVGFTLQTFAANGSSDFATAPAALTIKLPVGVTLSNNAVVNLPWIAN